MNSSTSAPECSATGTPDTAPRTAKPARSRGVLSVVRMRGLETAAGMLGGQARLAVALAIETRSLRAKLNAERGINNADLRRTADALDREAARLRTHADKLRAEIAA